MTTQFRLYWLSGKTELIEGLDFGDAWIKSGLNNDVLTMLDFWKEGEDMNYTYSKKERMWIKKPNN